MWPPCQDNLTFLSLTFPCLQLPSAQCSLDGSNHAVSQSLTQSCYCLHPQRTLPTHPRGSHGSGPLVFSFSTLATYGVFYLLFLGPAGVAGTWLFCARPTLGPDMTMTTTARECLVFLQPQPRVSWVAPLHLGTVFLNPQS